MSNVNQPVFDHIVIVAVIPSRGQVTMNYYDITIEEAMQKVYSSFKHEDILTVDCSRGIRKMELAEIQSLLPEDDHCPYSDAIQDPNFSM